jgi:drug/metabolite transporter (DMT)-like permease
VEWRAGYWIGVVYLGLIGTTLSFPLYFALIRAIGPGKAAYTSLVIPILAMALSTLFEHYVWSPLAIAGGLIALAGMAVAMLAPKPAAASPAVPAAD